MLFGDRLKCGQLKVSLSRRVASGGIGACSVSVPDDDSGDATVELRAPGPTGQPALRRVMPKLYKTSS